MTTVGEQLRSAKPPWVHLVVLDPGQKLESVLTAPARVCDAEDRRTAGPDEARAARRSSARCSSGFPADSGRNWDAFEELLASLDGLPAKGYLLILTGADELLSEDTEDYDTFIEIVKDVGEGMGNPAARAVRAPADTLSRLPGRRPQTPERARRLARLRLAIERSGG